MMAFFDETDKNQESRLKRHDPGSKGEPSEASQKNQFTNCNLSCSAAVLALAVKRSRLLINKIHELKSNCL